jgi:oxygen-dependent protoporphyrinogen oxidase
MAAPDEKSVAVVGAGMSGLTAAYRLRQAGWQVTIFESDDHAGGRVQTVAREGYLMDTGASAFADSYKAYIALAGELGLADEIVPVAPGVGIFRGTQLHELRMDRLLSSGYNTRLFSWPAKFRMARLGWDITVARLRGQLDYADMASSASLDTESASTYARRALGQEADDYLCSPVVRTMLIADPDKISKVELLSGVANIFTSRILTMRGGQGRVPRLLAERMQPLLKHTVEQVKESADGVTLDYRGPDGVLQSGHFDACVVACPLPQAAQICIDKQDLLQPLNAGLTYTQCITVALALKQRPRSPVFLVMMPTCEDAEIALMFIDHNKSPDRAPPGCGLIDCHWETDAAAKMMDRPDAEITARTLASVRRVFPELQAAPAFSHVTRWRRALPLTGVGAYRLIGDFAKAMNPRSRIQFASDYMSEAGQNSAVELGNRAAQRVMTL